MPDVADFTPIFQETVDRIRTRVDADANAGLLPSDPAFLDTTPGGFYFDTTGALILEIDRMWDSFGSEMVAAMFPAYAWGTYLDEHGITVGLIRKDAAPAAGTVTFTGTAGTFIATGTQVATPQPDPDSPPVVYATTGPATIPGGGSIAVAVQAVVAGTAGNQPAASVTVLLSPVAGITAVANAAAMSGGADVEADEAFRDRILLAYQGALGSGTVADYQSWALAEPGVGHVKVQPLWNGAGTVRVIVTDANNQPVPGAVVTSLQAKLDPVAGQGAGLAPIGATVTVTTPTTVTANVSATITPKAGYSLDGAGGTIAMRSDLTSSVTAYLRSLLPGESVILLHVSASLFEVEGVLDASAVQINGAAANLSIGATQVAVPGTVTLA